MNSPPSLSRRALLAVLATAAAMPRALAGDITNFKLTTPPIPAPELLFSDADGQPVSLSDFRGRPVLLNIWATWCKPCIAEMPALVRLQMALPDLFVLPVSMDRGGAKVVQEFYDAQKINSFPVLLERELSVRRQLKPRGLPLSLLINREGFELGRALGEVAWDDAALISQLRDLLAS
jgi:thiol-disulfide isomerase/thioredoxin